MKEWWKGGRGKEERSREGKKGENKEAFGLEEGIEGRNDRRRKKEGEGERLGRNENVRNEGKERRNDGKKEKGIK